MTSLVAAVADSLKRKPVRIGTHSGTFHADEALGCFMLRETQAFKGAEVVRTRSPEVLKDLDVIIDVGGVYDPSEPRLLATRWHVVPSHRQLRSAPRYRSCAAPVD